MYEGPIIDAHMHLWDLANRYAWLSTADPDFERLIGPYDALRRNFLAPDYVALTRGHRVEKSVHVQASGFPDDPVGETAWLQAQADRYGYPHGIVGFADLTDPGVDATLARHRRYRNLRGTRMPLNFDDAPFRRMAARGDYLRRDPRWRAGYARLSAYGLSFDLQIYDHQAEDAAALARDVLDVVMIVEHLGWPLDVDDDAGIERWSRHLAPLAACPNVFPKVSGIGCL